MTHPGAVALFCLAVWLTPANAQTEDHRARYIADVVAAQVNGGDDSGEEVTVEVTGVLTSALGTGPNPRRGYMQDATRGIGLWVGSDVLDGRRYSPGDLLQARGVVSRGRGGVRLRVSELRKVGRVPPPAPRELSAADVADDRYVGILARLRGTLLFTPDGPEEAVLEDETGRVPVDIPDELLLDAAFSERVFEGRRVTLTAFVDEESDRAGESRYQLSIDEGSDVAFGAPPPWRQILITVLSLGVLGGLVYMAGRRGLAERRSRDMEKLVEHLQETRTTLEESQRALARSERHFRSLVEHAPYGVFRTTVDGRIVSANPALAQMLGFRSAEELTGKHLGTELYESADDWAAVRAALSHSEVSPFAEVRWRRADGSVILVRTRFRVVAAGEEQDPALEVFVEDITERRRLGEQLRQAQKMEAVGQLAGGVAHDFNNLLTVILGSCDFLLAASSDESTTAEVREVRAAAERAAGLTQQLLAFSRRQPVAPEVLDPNQVVSDALSLLRRTVGEDITLRTDLRPHRCWTEVDPGQLHQVIMNLVVNGRDAMPNGGTITIGTKRVDFDEAAVQGRPGAKVGEYVAVSVTDTGEGMPAETMEHVFEPFFTTKGAGSGTGLGLATVYGIVKGHDGYIEVESDTGSGTRFTVYLRRCPAPREGADPSADPSTAPVPSNGTETILLVEDELPVRTLARRVLQRAGYHLLEAADGREGLGVADRFAGVIDAVVTDVVMPKMSGREMVEELRRSRSDIKSLYMSGYTDDAVIRYGVFEASEAFLRKPFTPDELLEQLRTLLDDRGSDTSSERADPVTHRSSERADPVTHAGALG